MEATDHIGLDETAARWHARMLADDCSDADRRALAAWRRHSPDHEEAYRRISGALRALDSARFDARLQLLAEQAYEASRAGVQSRRKSHMWSATIAASLALVALTFVPRGEVHRNLAPVVYETGQARSTVALPDGSTAALDVDTRIAVRMTGDAREIELLAGRALFDVAHDSQRPFSVNTKESRTTALGTRFQVAHLGGRVAVVLEQGSVAVEHREEDHVAWSDTLSPGERIVIDSSSSMRSKDRVDPLVATSWTQNRHIFRDTRLEDALEEINRYSSKKVRIGDSELADLRIAGSFIAGDGEQIMRAVASVLPLRLVSAGEREIIVFRRHSNIEQPSR